MSEWLRRWTRNPLGSARRGSNPLGVVFPLAVSVLAAARQQHSQQQQQQEQQEQQQRQQQEQQQQQQEQQQQEREQQQKQRRQPPCGRLRRHSSPTLSTRKKTF